MKAKTFKAINAMTEFFTYHADPDELSQILSRASTQDDTERDREIMRSLANLLAKAGSH